MKVFDCDKVQLIQSFFSACPFEIIPKKSLLTQGHRGLCFCVLLRVPSFNKPIFKLSIKFRSLIHFELTFIYDIMWVFNFILLHEDIQLSQNHLWENSINCWCHRAEGAGESEKKQRCLWWERAEDWSVLKSRVENSSSWKECVEHYREVR